MTPSYKWYLKQTKITWMDKKVLKLVAYLHKYMTELHQSYTEHAITIIWFVNIIRMTQYAKEYMSSSFDGVLQQWPGVKKSEIVFSQRNAITNIHV